MEKKDDKTATKTLKLYKGGRKRDIYEDAKWKKRPIDMDGETMAMPSSLCDDGEEDWRRSKAGEMIEQITSDPIEQRIAQLMLENYTEREIAKILNISVARVEWFMREIGAWKRNKQGDKKDS